AAEPGLRSDDEAGIYVHGRHVRAHRMGDDGDSGGPESRILLGALDLLAEFRREFAEHSRELDAGLLEQPAAQDRHHAAPARRSRGIGAVPGRALEASGRAAEELRRRLGLERLEGGASLVPQRLEPCAGARPAGVELTDLHGPRQSSTRKMRNAHSVSAFSANQILISDW